MSPFEQPGIGNFNLMFTLIPILIAIGFIVVIISIIFRSIRYFKNARSPKVSTYGRIVSKRMEVRQTSHHHHNNDIAGHHANSSRTYYYITMEFDNGERIEYLDTHQLYGLVVEGDTGFAQTQGEWIIAFERAS